MDTFIEKIVVRKKTYKDHLISAGMILAGVVLFFGLQMIQVLAQFFLLIAAAIVYLLYQFITSRNVEFEYIVTNGELDIDMIIAQRKRKRIFSSNCKDFEILAKLKGGLNDRRIEGVNKKILAVSSMDSDDVYFALLNYKGERTAVFFEPNERMLNAFRIFIPRKIETGG